MRLVPGLLLRAVRPVSATRPRPRPAGRRRPSARAAVLGGFVLIAAAQLGLGLAVETAQPEWRDPEYGHRLKQLQLLKQTHPGRPLVVAVGSSRTQMGLSPVDMGFPDEPGSPLVYNFGQAGAGPLQLALTAFRLLDAGVKPDFLLVEIFPAALPQDGPAEEQAKAWGPRLGLGDFRRLAPYCRDTSALWRAWADTRLAPWHAHRRTLMSHWQPRWLPPGQQLDYQWTLMDPFGFLPCPLTAVSDLQRDEHTRGAAAEHADHLRHFRVGAMSERAFRDIVARCRVEGVPVAFYLMPEGPAFRGWYTDEARAGVSAFTDRLTRELGCPVFDATAGFAEDEFFDSHHLLRPGAARFSRRLADDHLRRWVRRTDNPTHGGRE